MKTKIFLSVAGVATGITSIILACNALCNALEINDFYQDITFWDTPEFVVKIVGYANLLTFLPIFIAGILTLKPSGAIGKSSKLVTSGIYKYLRNPMYAGVSFTLVGLGLVLNITGVVMAGLLWLVISTFQSKREEKRLLWEFGDDYILYKGSTPLFVPEFKILFKDLASVFYKFLFKRVAI